MKRSKALSRRDFLELLARSKNAKRRKLLANWADKEDILAVSECAANTLSGNVHLKPETLRRLKRHKNALRSLARKNTSLREKRRTIMKGGFLSMILPAVLGTLSSIFTKSH